MSAAYSPGIACLQLHAQLLRARIACGISQEEAGRRIGVSRRTFARFENCDVEPSLSQALRWAALFGLALAAEPISDCASSGTAATPSNDPVSDDLREPAPARRRDPARDWEPGEHDQPRADGPAPRSGARADRRAGGEAAGEVAGADLAGRGSRDPTRVHAVVGDVSVRFAAPSIAATSCQTASSRTGCVIARRCTSQSAGLFTRRATRPFGTARVTSASMRVMRCWSASRLAPVLSVSGSMSIRIVSSRSVRGGDEGTGARGRARWCRQHPTRCQGEQTALLSVPVHPLRPAIHRCGENAAGGRAVHGKSRRAPSHQSIGAAA